MNARRARAQRRARTTELAATLAAMDAAEPRFLRRVGDSEAWKVGPAVVVVPVLRDTYPAALKNAIDRRRRASLHGACDCGARRRVDQHGRLAYDHDDDCPAADANLDQLAADHGLVATRWIQ